MVLVRWLLVYLLRFFLSLRYRVRISGLEKLRPLKGKALVLPNHPMCQLACAFDLHCVLRNLRESPGGLGLPYSVPFSRLPTPPVFSSFSQSPRASWIVSLPDLPEIQDVRLPGE